MMTAQGVSGPAAQYGAQQLVGPQAYYPLQTDMTAWMSSMMNMLMMVMLFGFMFTMIKPVMERATA